MTGQLKLAFEEASKLPEKAQFELAEFVLLELSSERRWLEAFAGSGKRLQAVADNASTGHGRGSTRAGEPDAL
jgi:hypothetical protein